MSSFFLIVAADQKGGIGKNGKIPWHLSKDLEYFRKMTVGNGKNVVIMGRTTWESIPKNRRPLKDRRNIVLTRNLNYRLPPGVERAHQFDEALKMVKKNSPEKIFVIGGAQVFEEALQHPRCTQIYLTEVLDEFDCDTFFPPIDLKKFKKIEESKIHEEHGIRFRFLRYKLV